MDAQQSNISGHDAPIQTVQDDLLNAVGVARAIHCVLATAPPDWSTRVGLYGAWGSGKTSILNLLRILEEEDGALVISFSAWAASGESGVINQFYSTLATRLGEEDIQLPIKQRAKVATAKAGRFGFLAPLVRIGAENLAPVPPIITKAAAEALSKLASAATSWTKIGRKDLEAIAELLNGRRVVVFIDDLDRADPRLVPKTLLAMRELLDWPGFSFVLAFDKRAVSSALSEYSTAFGDDAQGFLEKVIDIPFEVPDATEEHRKKLAETVFKACCAVMPTEAISAVLPVLPNQPRRVKLIARMMGALQPSLLRHAPEDVDWIGLGLYLVVKEASQATADWVVKAATIEGEDWALWMGGKEEAEKRQGEAKTILQGLLSTPEPPLDSERIIAAALRLLQHWNMSSNSDVLYWVGLAYREPSITRFEFQKLLETFVECKKPHVIDEAIRLAAHKGGITETEAAIECLRIAITNYDTALDAMSGAQTTIEWECRHTDAQNSLFLLEHLWTQKSNAAVALAASRGSISATLLSVVGKWLTWTKNEKERPLREREQGLALAATANCLDPELLFAETDPFWNSSFSESQENAEMINAWRGTLRDSLAPRVVSRFCRKFLVDDGLVSVATGDDKIGPWLVENSKSPLYTKPELTDDLVQTLRAGTSATDAIRVALSKNAVLYLKQLLFQTRNGSWGGVDHARAIHVMRPEVIPAAWAAVIRVAAPYRMRSSLRKLRADLIAISVDPIQLASPSWLGEDDQGDA